MAEPIYKKSGASFRKLRAHKIEFEKNEMNKIEPLTNFFKPIDQCETRNVSSSKQTQHTENVLEQDFNDNIQEPETQIAIESVLDVTNQTDANIHVDANGNSIEFRSVNQNDNNRQCSTNSFEDTQDQDAPTDKAFGSIDDNPSKWLTNDLNFIENFLKVNAEQSVKELNFVNSKRQYSGQNRSCSTYLFHKKRINGENIQRSWIFYSQSLGKMFCIYCKLFGNQSTGIFMSEAFDDWKHPNRIEEHEKSKGHCHAAYLFAKRSEASQNIHSELQKEILKGKNYWREVLKRILSVIRFLSSRGLPLRGSNENVGNSNNGNYLGALELLSEYDPFLRTHLEQTANKGKGSVSYLSSTIADEFIAILGEEVRELIVKAVLYSKYFSLIVDSTPDVSHIDQLTICIRYVDDAGFAIERFLGFLANAGHKGIEMKFEVLDFLKKMKIIIGDCRGQSYDNASNMKGIYNGFQALIKEVCPLAEYVPCSPHSLNLILKHACENIPEAVRFFLFVQNIYVFFTESTKRREILLDHLKKNLEEKQKDNPRERLLVPKKLSSTRWSARHDSCRALKSGYKAFVSALREIFENPVEKKIVQIEAESLYNDFFKLETAVLLEFWSTILHRVNVTSKSLQNSWIDIDTSISLYKSLASYINDLRNEERFDIFVDQAKTLIMSCIGWETKNPDLSYNCFCKRTRKRNTRYDIGKARDTTFSDSENFRVTIFYGSLDFMRSDFALQINAYETVLTPFSFLFKLEEISESDIRKGAPNLVNRYATDLDQDFVNECFHFKHLMTDINAAIAKDIEKDRKNNMVEDDEMSETTSDRKSKLVSKPARMLQYLKQHKLESTFPNIDVALRIFECIAVANTTGERAFSALKRVKNPHRSTLGADKLNDLSTLFIENDLLNKIDDDMVINKFIELKCRKRVIRFRFN